MNNAESCCFYQELIDRYSTSLELPGDTVTVILERLRCHSLEKLASRTKFQKTGVATLKVKLAGCVPEEVIKTLSNIPDHRLDIVCFAEMSASSILNEVTMP